MNELLLCFICFLIRSCLWTIVHIGYKGNKKTLYSQRNVVFFVVIAINRVFLIRKYCQCQKFYVPLHLL